MLSPLVRQARRGGGNHGSTARRTSDGHLRARLRVLAELLEYEGGRALADHHACGVGVAAGREGHDRGVGDAEPAHAVHAQAQVDDALVRVRARVRVSVRVRARVRVRRVSGRPSPTATPHPYPYAYPYPYPYAYPYAYAYPYSYP